MARPACVTGVVLLAMMIATGKQAQEAVKEEWDCEQVIQFARDGVRDALAKEDLAKRYIVPRHWDLQTMKLAFEIQLAWINAKSHIKVALDVAHCDTDPPLLDVLAALVDVHLEALKREAAAYGTPVPWGTPTTLLPTPLRGTITPSAAR